MDDRELLRLAAKAIGGGEIVWTDIDGNRYAGDPERPWNPLKDDGDALRLAIKLGICISFIPECDTVQVFQERITTGEPFNVHSGGLGDVETRLVIVQAAAEIGRQL